MEHSADFEVQDGVLVRYPGTDAHVTVPDTRDRVEIPGNRCAVALSRLRYPYGLSQQAREQYTQCLNTHGSLVAKRLIAEEREDDLGWMLEAGFFSRDQLTGLVEYAGALNKTAITALLLAGQHKLCQHIGSYPDFRL